MTKRSHFSRYNKFLTPLVGSDYDPRVLYMMFNYLKLHPKDNEKQIRQIFNGGLIWNNMMIAPETIKRLYPIFNEEVEKEDIIKGESKTIKKITITESQFNRLMNIQ